MHFVNIKPLSINETYAVSRKKVGFKTIGILGTTKKYKDFKKKMKYILPDDICVDYDKIRLDVIICFKRKNSDIDNPLKSFIDSLQEKYGFDDKIIYQLNVTKRVVKSDDELGFFFNISGL